MPMGPWDNCNGLVVFGANLLEESLQRRFDGVIPDPPFGILLTIDVGQKSQKWNHHSTLPPKQCRFSIFVSTSRIISG